MRVKLCLELIKNSYPQHITPNNINELCHTIIQLPQHNKRTFYRINELTQQINKLRSQQTIFLYTINTYQKLIRTQMIQIHPLQIVQVALSLGYSEQDLYPLTLERLEQQSIMITKKMTQKEKQFYLHKKMTINQARRQKILKQVYHQAQVLQNQVNKFRKYNPKVKEIIEQHERSIKKSLKYNQVRSRASSRSQSNNTSSHKLRSIDLGSNPKLHPIDLGRQSPIPSNRSSLSKTSQTSRNINSQVSNRSNRTTSSANSLSRSKLDLVKEKQKQQLQMKKRMLLEKQRQAELKFLKAEENVVNKSRKVKIRSEISQRIVKENKQQMDIIRNMGTKDHFQSVKYNIVKHNDQRKKILSSISQSQNKDLKLLNVNSTKKQIQKSKEYMNKYVYEEKQRNSQEWQSQYNSLKMRNLELTHNERQTKERLANQRRSFQARQQKKFREQVMVFEQRRISDAQQRRQQQLAQRKLSGISQQLRRQIVDKNKKSLQTSDSMRKKVITKHYRDKVQELSYIDSLKQLFVKDRDQLKRGHLGFFKTFDHDNSINEGYYSKEKYSGSRNSVTSKNNRYSYFDTLLY